MKNYDELTNDLLERRDRYITEQKRKRKTVISVVTSSCCFCLVALLGFGIWQGGMLNRQPPIILDDSTVIGEKDYIDPNELDNSSRDPIQNNSDPSVDENSPVQIIWTINRVDTYIGAAKLKFDTGEYYSEKKTLADITAYLGRDLSTLESVMSQGFEFIGRYETDFYYKQNGEIAYDSCAFGYKTDGQEVSIEVSKIGVPYDCIYMMDNPIVSEINCADVIMGGIYKSDNSDKFRLLFADFSHEGLQYRVTVEDVTLDDGNYLDGMKLVDIIVDLIK